MAATGTPAVLNADGEDHSGPRPRGALDGNDMQQGGALTGIRVLDLTQALTGPLISLYLPPCPGLSLPLASAPIQSPGTLSRLRQDDTCRVRTGGIG